MMHNLSDLEFDSRVNTPCMACGFLLGTNDPDASDQDEMLQPLQTGFVIFIKEACFDSLELLRSLVSCCKPTSFCDLDLRLKSSTECTQ